MRKTRFDRDDILSYPVTSNSNRCSNHHLFLASLLPSSMGHWECFLRWTQNFSDDSHELQRGRTVVAWNWLSCCSLQVFSTCPLRGRRKTRVLIEEFRLYPQVEGINRPNDLMYLSLPAASSASTSKLLLSQGGAIIISGRERGGDCSTTPIIYLSCT